MPYGTREMRIMRGEQKQRESATETAQFAEPANRVRTQSRGLNSEAGAGALNQQSAIKYDSYFHASEFCKRYNEADSAKDACI